MAFTVFIWDSLSKSFWFYLPVFLANMLIYVVFSIVKLGIPLDLYKEFKGRRIFGHGRNVSGFFFYIFTALLIGIIQERPIEAFYLGAGGIFGCYLSSFIKRRMGIKQGDYFFLIDQTDFILGASLFYFSKFPLEVNILISGLVLALILHHSINLLRRFWESFLKKTGTTR